MFSIGSRGAQPDRWSSIISRDKTGGGMDVQDGARLELDCGGDEEPTVLDDGSGSGCFFGLLRRRGASPTLVDGIWDVRSYAVLKWET